MSRPILLFVARPGLTFAFLCAALAGQAQLTASLTLSDHNGYNVSCFGGADGSIDLTVTGGTPPYTYEWSTGSTAEDVFDLRAGFISVVVRDAQNAEAREERTLTEPHALIVDAVPYVYGSGHHVSCYNCYNGSIAVTVSDGVAPYNYAWVDGPTTEDRTQLDAGTYEVHVTDANGCLEKSGALSLTQPERDDWSRAGNAGTDPNTQFIGTTDNKDVVFKSNGAERLRLLSGGDVKVGSLAATGNKLIYADQNGILKRVDWPQMSDIPWFLGGNNNVTSTTNRIGPVNSIDFLFLTGNEERLRITTEGKVGIGTSTPEQQLEVAHADESGGINIRNLRTDANAHSEIRFFKNDDLRYGLGCDLLKNGAQDFFLWDHLSGATRLKVDADGRVLIGNAVPQSSALYKLYVEGGIVSRDVKVTANNFPDYVFRKNYRLMPLDEVAAFIDRNGHLPHIPSAAEVEANEGVEVGDLQLRLLRTVEEQQLYILQLRDEMSGLKARLAELEKR